MVEFFLPRSVSFIPGKYRRLAVGIVLGMGICVIGAGETESPAPAEESRLDLDRIFGSNEFDAASTGRIVWETGSDSYWELRDAETGPGKDIVRVDIPSGEAEVVVPASAMIPPDESVPLTLDGWEFSSDDSRLLIYTNSERVWRRKTRGDYWVLDVTAREMRRLGGEVRPASLMFATFSPDGTRVAYVHDRDLFVQDVRDGQITRLTTRDHEDIINGTFDWVYEEEFGLRRGFRWSPDGEHLAYWQLDTRGVPRFSLVDYTDGLYPELNSFPYPKAGEKNSAVRIGIVPADGGPTTWLDIPGDPRNHYIPYLAWLNDPQEIILQEFNRLQNTVRFFRGTAGQSAVEPWFEESDPAWLDLQSDLYWHDHDRRFVWLSERDGWRRAWRIDRAGEILNPITGPGYDVIELLGVDSGGTWLYYLASPDDPVRRYLYRSRLDGTHNERLTPPDQTGSNRYQISPEGTYAIHTRSTFESPPEVALVRLPEHEALNVLVGNEELKEKLDGLELGATEFFRVDIGEGIALDGWAIRPTEFESGRRYPVLFYVYGEPAGTTVVDRWRGKSYLWNQMLAQQGYFVMSVDNRGTPAPKGRAWRKCIYRKVGVLASADQAAAAGALLASREALDPGRVGVWGWSGGGSMTLNALFRYPDLYQAGMAVAPVSNQRYYDTIYQERYMGLPSDNVEGYRRGSPLNFAGQLKGKLLLIHGTGDDNVHYQNTAALINELVRCNKTFSLMLYPNRTHSIRHGHNTSRHLYGTLTRFLNQSLPPGPRKGSPEGTAE